MNELRKDCLLERWVIIAADRGARPHDYIKGAKKIKEKTPNCFFCPGSEEKTPPELGRIEAGGRWIIRCFSNKFPATAQNPGSTNIEHACFVRKPAYGKHEVIVETPDHEKHFGDLSVKHIEKLLDMYTERIVANKEDPLIKNVMIFKNEGEDAGISLEHSHTQLIALGVIPPSIREVITACRRYRKKFGGCAICDLWQMEQGSKRMILEDDNMIAYAPFASRFPFEVRLIPKRHVTSLEHLEPSEKRSLAGFMKKIIGSLGSDMNHPAYNFYIHTAPKRHDMHMHIEICPRINKWAGFELGSGIIINTMPPETAAEYYRSILR